MPKQRNAKNIVILVICIILAGLRIWLAAHTNYQAVTNPYDDELQMRQGLTIYLGEWLGAYTLVTMIKGIIYPAFLALCMHLGITYGVGLGIVTVLAAAVFALMILIITPDRRIAAAGFALAAFHPVGYYGLAAVRIYRNALVPPLVLILVSCLLAVFFLREKTLAKSIPWFAGLAVSFALFCHLREDSIWIYPLMIAATALTVLGRFLAARKPAAAAESGKSAKETAKAAESGKSAKETGKAAKKSRNALPECVLSVVLCLTPFLASWALGSSIAGANLSHYGVCMENDRVKGNFAEMMSLIGSVDDPRVGRYVWITKDMLFQCVETSPTLKSMEEEIIFRYEDSASHQETADGEKVSEVMGDYTQWILRNAFYDHGLYRDAKQTDETIGNIVRELKAAYADGTLKKDSRIHLSSQGRGMTAGELAALTGETLGGMLKLAAGGGLEGGYPFITTTPRETRKAYELVLGTDLGRETVESGAYQAANGIFMVLTWVFRIGMALMHAAAAAVFFRGAAQCMKDRRKLPALLPVLVSAGGLVLSAALLVYMITAFTSFLPERYFYNYSTGYFPMVLAADMILLVTFLNEKKA